MESATPPSTALERLRPADVARTLTRDPRLIFAVGPLEDHGPDLPVGTGIRIASAVVDAAAERTGILRAPALPYGVLHRASGEVPGLAGLRRKTLHRAVNELLAGWEDHGVSEFVLVTAHGSESHLDALLMALTSESRTTVFDLGSVPIDDVASDVEVRDGEGAILRYLDGTGESTPGDDGTYDGGGTSGEALFERYVAALVSHLEGNDPADRSSGHG